MNWIFIFFSHQNHVRTEKKTDHHHWFCFHHHPTLPTLCPSQHHPPSIASASIMPLPSPALPSPALPLRILHRQRCHRASSIASAAITIAPLPLLCRYHCHHASSTASISSPTIALLSLSRHYHCAAAIIALPLLRRIHRQRCHRHFSNR